MSLYDAHGRAEALVSRASELQQCLARYRAELDCLALGMESMPPAVSADIRDLDDLLHVMDELRQAAAQRVMHVSEEISALPEDTAHEGAAAAAPARLQRYLSFAGPANLPLPVN